METPAVVPAVKKAFDINGVITFIVLFILMNVILDVLGNFFPIAPVFIMKPVSTVKALLAPKTPAK